MKKLLHDLARILSEQLIILFILLGLAVLAYSYRKSLLITYHRLGRRSALKAMRHTATPNLQRDRYRNSVDRLARHEDALIRLGYLEQRRFQPKFLTGESNQVQAMLKEYRDRHPGCSYALGWGKGLIITDRPARIPTWESLIRKYDVPPTDPNRPVVP